MDISIYFLNLPSWFIIIQVIGTDGWLVDAGPSLSFVVLR